MAVTIRDIARVAGVSPATVCRALTTPERVREATRLRVVQTAAELGYSPNRAARGLITGRTGNLGIIVPDLANPFFPGVVKGMQARAREADYAVFLADTDEEPTVEASLVRALSKQVDGIVLCSPRMPEEELRGVVLQSPIVMINRRVGRIPSVTVDNLDGMRQAVAHLTALGHRRVAYVGGPRSSWSNRERSRALRAATTTTAGTTETARTTTTAGTTETTAGATATASTTTARSGTRLELVEVGNVAPQFEGGVAAADLVLAAGVTAVIAYNDVIALGLLNRFRARGVPVPQQMSVIGVDDIALATMTDPSLTTIALPTEQLGRAGVDLLLALLENPNRDGANRRELPAQLMVRGSTGAAPDHPQHIAE